MGALLNRKQPSAGGGSCSWAGNGRRCLPISICSAKHIPVFFTCESEEGGKGVGARTASLHARLLPPQRSVLKSGFRRHVSFKVLSVPSQVASEGVSNPWKGRCKARNSLFGLLNYFVRGCLIWGLFGDLWCLGLWVFVWFVFCLCWLRGGVGAHVQSQGELRAAESGPGALVWQAPRPLAPEPCVLHCRRLGFFSSAD